MMAVIVTMHMRMVVEIWRMCRSMRSEMLVHAESVTWCNRRECAFPIFGRQEWRCDVWTIAALSVRCSLACPQTSDAIVGKKAGGCRYYRPRQRMTTRNRPWFLKTVRREGRLKAADVHNHARDRAHDRDRDRRDRHAHCCVCARRRHGCQNDGQRSCLPQDVSAWDALTKEATHNSDDIAGAQAVGFRGARDVA
jgi:hypothetical protein